MKFGNKFVRSTLVLVLLWLLTFIPLLRKVEEVLSKKKKLRNALVDFAELHPITHSIRPFGGEPLWNSTFLGSVESQPHLPICQSGNEFLSTNQGGDWKKDASYVKDKSVFDGFDFKSGPHRQGASCDSPYYTDPYVWSASCSVPTWSPSLPQQSKTSLRVMLAGDSITKQIYDTSLAAPLDLGSIELSNFYVVPMLKSTEFTSKVCHSCGDALMNTPELFDPDLKWMDDDEFLYRYLDQDYVFYNEYHHCVDFIVRGVLRLSAKGTGNDKYEENPNPELLSELYHWFGQQMQRKAELLASIPATVYYTTSPPHAFLSVVSKDDDSMNMNEPIPVPTRETSTEECYHNGSHFGGAFCYSLFNQIAAAAFLSNNHEVLDFASVMGRRVDAHPCRVDTHDGVDHTDCLHFCMPGPTGVMLAAILVEVLADSKRHSLALSSREKADQLTMGSSATNKLGNTEGSLSLLTTQSPHAKTDVAESPTITTNSKPPGVEPLWNSTFLGSVEPRPHLPTCQSGTEFLSTERGGDWKKKPSYIKDKSVFDGFEFKEHLGRASCDSPYYTDPYVWSASCRISAELPPGEQSKPPPLRVMLAGDSITKQIYDTSLAIPLLNSAARMELSNLYVIPMLKSAKFTSKVCPLCGDALIENPELFDKDLKWMDDDEFLSPYLDQDYVFYNEYAHFTGKIVNSVTRLSAEGSMDHAHQWYQGNPDPVLVSELYHWFQQQMEHKAKLFATITAKVYYNTVPPHAIWDVVSREEDGKPVLSVNLNEPLPVATLEATANECYNNGPHFGGAFCYSLVNRIAATAFQSNNLEVLDMAPTMGRRVDAHPCRVDTRDGVEHTDCLHFCMPGPVGVMLAAILVEVLTDSRNDDILASSL